MAQVSYQAVDAFPAVGWGDSLFGCFSDMEVCLCGAFPLGCMQYLFAVSVPDPYTGCVHGEGGGRQAAAGQPHPKL